MTGDQIINITVALGGLAVGLMIGNIMVQTLHRLLSKMCNQVKELALIYRYGSVEIRKELKEIRTLFSLKKITVCLDPSWPASPSKIEEEYAPHLKKIDADMLLVYFDNACFELGYFKGQRHGSSEYGINPRENVVYPWKEALKKEILTRINADADFSKFTGA